MAQRSRRGIGEGAVCLNEGFVTAVAPRDACLCPWHLGGDFDVCRVPLLGSFHGSLSASVLPNTSPTAGRADHPPIRETSRKATLWHSPFCAGLCTDHTVSSLSDESFEKLRESEGAACAAARKV